MQNKHDSSILKDFTPFLQDKVALVTGGSRGIGKAIAKSLSERGAKIVLHARNHEQLERTKREIEEQGGNCSIYAVDVRNEQSIVDSLAEISKVHPGGIDILVNNAGVYHTAPVKDHASELWFDTIATNLSAPFFYCRSILPEMIARKWGRIINISSISGRTGEIHGAAYCASKFGLIGLTQSLALEAAADGVTVNAVCPGWVDTDMSRQQLNDENWCKLSAVNPSESMELARLSVPQMRFIEPGEVGEVVGFLCSNAARGITGQSINVCGGMCLS
jgi:NAD(P)-dependent dehydrogenase (short-subunit alcohol dehydrogenase family)